MTLQPPAARIALSWLWLAYPLLVFIGLQFLAPRYLALLIALTLMLRWHKALPSMLQRFSGLQKGAGLLLLGWLLMTSISNDEALLRCYPAIINLGMLVLFGLSLQTPPSMVEIFARMQQPQLPAAAIGYTRQVTKIWCMFFLINGAMALYTAFYTSRELWALYNGAVAYLLMALLFAAEWLVRRRFMRGQQ